MDQVVLRAQDLGGLLNQQDKDHLEKLDDFYRGALQSFQALDTHQGAGDSARENEKVIELFNSMGHYMKEALTATPQIRVYSFELPSYLHGEASRLISKLRDVGTPHEEFVYYIQRAYELLFNFAFGATVSNKQFRTVRTPVTNPVQNFAVHKIPDVDNQIENTVMCVMLRGALLPSMIMSKEIQENSSSGYVTPFALFRIRRNDTRHESDMEYVLDLQKSFFDLQELQGKDLVFADPMNATGGSLVTIVKYLETQNIEPRSIKVFNVISSFKGSLQVVRALKNVTLYTLWMDPVLNDKAYIMPGLGDAGDRLNGKDSEESPRNMIQLMADYGTNIMSLYRAQVQKIEKTILG